ncbi:MAG: hypothetical protein P8J87_14465, partial [Verrucomicrobiales bacterium]|nr:hypothetical protein [Verrucomicrobiales bacterium]
DETLVPLAANLDPNTPVEVTVRLGQRAVDPRSVRLVAPAVLAPALIATWTVTGDPGRRLLPIGSMTPELAHPVRTETGFEWLILRGWPRAVLLGVLVFAGLILVRKGSVCRVVGTICVVLAVLGSVILAIEAGEERRVNVATLEFVAPVVGAGQPVTVGLKNVAMWEAMVSWPGAVLVVIGLWLIVAVRLWKVPCGEEITKGLPGGLSEGGGRFLFCALGWLLVSAGLLAQRGGAVLFFVTAGVFLVVVVILPLLRSAGANWKEIRWNRLVPVVAAEEPPAVAGVVDNVVADEEVKTEKEKEKEKAAEEPKAKKAKRASKKKGGGSGGVTPLLLALGVVSGFSGAGSDAHGAELMADRTEQRIEISGGRLYGEVTFQLTGEEGETLVLLNAPAVLTKFSGEGMRIGKREVDGKSSYQVVIEAGGVLTGVLGYELALGDAAAGFLLPTARAAVQQVEVRYDKAGWEFSTAGAILSEPLEGLEAGESGARLAVGPVGPHKIVATPKGRDVTAEKAEYFVEVSNLFIPGAGYVDGRHRVTVRPSKGQVGELVCDVPDGFTVSDVTGEKVGGWRFDPENGTLRVEFSPAFTGEQALLVGTQKGSGALPADIILQPLIVRGAVGQVGMAALGFGSDAQPEKVVAEGMSKVNLEDFDAGLGGGENGVTLHEAYRYGQSGGTLTASVGEVTPEVRVATRQTLSIGEERLVLAVDVVATITRAGLFKLSFPLLDGLEIESVSGGVLSHWTESVQSGERIITLHLNGRTLGEQSFVVSIAGTSPGAHDGWAVPKFLVREATRQTGQLLVVPDQGVRVRAVSRSDVSQLDARKVSGNRLGTLAFRLLSEDWSLQLGLEALDPWVTAQVLQEVTVREGLTRTHLKVAYRIENAAVKAVRVRLPGLTDAEVKTVRASGDAVKEIVEIEGEPELWE